MSLKRRKHQGRRKKSKHPNLKKQLNRVVLRYFLDFDYIDKLDEKAKDFLDKFVKEDYTADFRGDKPLTKSKKRRREVYKDNNRRNRDVMNYNYSIVDGYNRTDQIENVKDRSYANNVEDTLIKIIDLKNKKS